MIYLIILAILVIMAILDFSDLCFEEKKNDKSKHSDRKIKSKLALKNKLLKNSIYIVCLSIFAGCRYYTGLDYSTYADIFYQIRNGVNIHLEIGFVYLNQLIAKYYINPGLVFLILATLTITFKAIIIKLDTKRIFFSFFIAFSLYFFIGTMGQMRSTFAQAIDFIALYLYMKNKRIIPLILILISILFHSSAIVFLLIFIIGARRYNTTFIIVLLTVCAIGGHFLDIKGIGFEFKDSFGFIGTKIYQYTNVGTQKIGLTFNLIFDILIVVFGVVMRKIYTLNNRKFNVLFNIYIGSLISFLLFNNYLVIGVRFSNYFRLPLILLLPYLIEKIKNKKIRILAAGIFIFIFVMMDIRFLKSNYAMYIPYRINLFGNIISL